MRESKTRTGRFLGGKLIFDDAGLISFYEGQQGAAKRQNSWGVFQGDAQGVGWLDAGPRAGFPSSRPPPLWTLIFQFPCFCMITSDLEKLGPVDQTHWSVICPLCCWERKLWVGDNSPSQSRLLSIWRKEK